MQTVIEQLKTSARYVVGAVFDGVRIGTILVLEPVARSMIGRAYPISMIDRVRIVQMAQKVDTLARIAGSSAAAFERYGEERGELIRMLTPQRIIALATFRGMRDPEDVPVVAQRVIDVVDAIVARFGEDVGEVRRQNANLIELITRQRSSLAAATAATLDVASQGTWTSDLATTIRRIAAERDETRREVIKLRALASMDKLVIGGSPESRSLEPNETPIGTFNEHGD